MFTRAATPETEQAFLDIAMHTTAAKVERVAAAYRRTRVDPAQPDPDMQRFARRSETRSGMVRIDVQLPPEQANVVWEAMLAAMDAGRSEGASAETGASAEAPREVDPSELEAERADALVNVAQAYLQHDEPRTLGSGYELVMMTTPEQLQHAPGGVGGFLRDGTPVPHHIARMLACDCTRVDVTKTSQSNLVLLCPSHHTLVHEGRLSVTVRDDKLEFENAYGLTIPTVPPRPGPSDEIRRWLHEEPQIAHFPQWDGQARALTR